MLLTVIHRRLPDRSTLLNVSAGWHMHLDILVARAAGREPTLLGGLEPAEGGVRPAAAGLIVHELEYRTRKLEPVSGKIRCSNKRWSGGAELINASAALKRVAAKRIHVTRFKLLFCP